MAERKARVAWIIAVAAIAFGAAVLILMQAMPGPRTKTDYLVIGTVGTFASLGVLFLLLSKGMVKGAVHRRRKQ